MDPAFGEMELIVIDDENFKLKFTPNENQNPVSDLNFSVMLCGDPLGGCNNGEFGHLCPIKSVNPIISVLEECTEEPCEIEPSITCSGDITVSTDEKSPNATVNYLLPIVTDPCGVGNSIPVLTVGSASGSEFPIGTSNIEYSYEGKTCSFSIAVTDSEPPTITNCPQNVSYDLSDNCSFVVPDLSEVFDYCDNVSVSAIVQIPEAGTVLGQGDNCIEAVVFLVDPSDNVNQCAFGIKLQDNTDPSFTPPPSITIDCSEDKDDLDNTGNVSGASDGCDDNVVVTYSDDISGFDVCSNSGTIIRTWTVTDASGNSETQNQTIIVTDNGCQFPNEFQPSTINACTGTDTELTAPSGYSYSWSTGSTSQSITVSAAGQYPVTITNSDNCTQVLVYDVVYNSSITSAAFSADQNICEGDDVEFSITVSGGTAPYTVVYTDGTTNEILNNYQSGDAISLVSLSSDTSFTLIYVVDINGCFIASQDNIEINVGTDPSEPQPDDIEICSSQSSTTLTAPSGYNYLWFDNSTGNTKTVSGSGTYNLTITNSDGCDQVLTYKVDLFPSISGVVFSSDKIICEGNAINLSATITGGTSPYTLQINDGTSTSSYSNYSSGSDLSFSPTSTTTYSLVSVVDANGCTFSSSAKAVITVADCDISNTFMPGDPCTCNDDQSANGAMDGTFGETISVSPSTGVETWTIVSVASLSGGTLPSGINIGDLMTYDASTQRHIFTFNHTDRSGFLIMVEGPNPEGDINNVTLEISNICKYPIIEQNLIPDSINLCMDGLLSLEGLNAETSGMPGEFSFLINGIVANEINTEDLAEGEHILTWMFEGEFMSNANGTLSSIAYPGCSTLVDETFKVAREPLSIACNDQVNVTLTPDCEVSLSPQVLVEGELPITYTLNLPDGQSASALYDESFEGLDWSGLVNGASTLITYSISSHCGIDCWGDILLEHKYLPELSCDDLEVFCYQNTSPGEVVIEYTEDENAMTYSVAGTGTAPDTLRSDFGFDSQEPLQDLIIDIDLEVASTNEIEIRLLAPDGTSVALLPQNAFGNCQAENLRVTFSDEATLDINDLADLANCNQCLSAAFCGEVKPSQPLSILDNLSSPSGLWTVDIINYGGEPLSYTDLQISLAANRVIDTIPFPLEGEIIPSGDNTYILEDLNCQTYALSYVDDVPSDNCSGASIIRTWHITSQDSGESQSCNQSITLKRVASNLTVDDILFPPNFDRSQRPAVCWSDLSSFGNYPTTEITGTPSLPNDAIELCGNYEFISNDTRIDGCNERNFKVIREWQFIDWCTTTILEHNQIIEVYEKGQELSSNVDTITIDADQSCLANWEIDYSLILGDGFNLSEYRISISGAETEDINGDGLPDVINDLALGATQIVLSLTNDCNASSTLRLTIEVEDKHAPNLICVQYTSVVLDDVGCIILKPEQFAASSFDNCSQELTYRIRNEGEPNWVEQLELCCGCSSPMRTLEIEVADASGNRNVCFVQIEIENLSESAMAGVSGRIMTEGGLPLEQTELHITNSGGANTLMSMTNHAGYFAFEALEMDIDYQLTPARNTSYLEGVSTLDLILIQRHILGIEKLTSPYQIIASDTDNSGAVNGVDLITLRKLILGITEDLPNGQSSWRFPSADYVFMDELNPFPFREDRSFTMTDSMPEFDFIGVKIGDVNESFEEGLRSGSLTQRASSSSPYTLELEGGILSKDKEQVISLSLPQSACSGLQMELVFAEGIEIVDAYFSSSDLNMDYHIIDNTLRLSAISADGQALFMEDELLSIEVRSKQSIKVSEAIWLSEAYPAEWYDENLRSQPLALERTASQKLEIKQSVPNPFNDQTQIAFIAPESGEVTLQVSDINGRVVFSDSYYSKAGNQVYYLQSEKVYHQAGVYFVTITQGSESETIRVVKF